MAKVQRDLERRRRSHLGMMMSFRWSHHAAPADDAAHLLLLLCIIMIGSMLLPLSNAQRYDCDPCIDRPRYKIQAITHGLKTDKFWLQVRAAAIQAAADLRVHLDFQLYETFDPANMAADIVRAVTRRSSTSPDVAPPDALIVTIPSPAVHDAIQTALAAGVPVFGMNSGYQVAESLGLLAFAAMDEYVGGQQAAREFLKQRSQLSAGNITKALFVNHEKGNTALDLRRDGFQQGIGDIPVDELVILAEAAHADDNAKNANNNNEQQQQPQDQETWLSEQRRIAEQQIREATAGCPYEVILLAGAPMLDPMLRALEDNHCTTVIASSSSGSSNNSPKTNDETTNNNNTTTTTTGTYMLGTFDVSASVYHNIALGKLHFTVSQQQYLQGALSVVQAALYATTGKKLARSAESDFGIYLTGPSTTHFHNLPTDTMQTCEADAFPVCPNTKAADGVTESECPCLDRSTIKIGGVLHGFTTNAFWDAPFAAARQAAQDVGIELALDRFAPVDDKNVWYAKMASKIITLCRAGGVHGIFVTLTYPVLAAAVQECLNLNVPVVSINTGAELSVELGLMHHIAQQEYVAGFEAGKRLIAAGMTAGVCANHVYGNPALFKRCQGFADAIAENNITYIGMPEVPLDIEARFIKNIEEAVGYSGDWKGVGMLMLDAQLVDQALHLQDKHPSLLMGTFDKTDQMYHALDAGRLLFGIDQEPFLQGYVPVWLLMLQATTNQRLSNVFIETGPRFIETSPAEELVECEMKFFESCPPPVHVDLNQLTHVRPAGLTLAAIVIVSSVWFAVWVLWHWKQKTVVVANAQPEFLLITTLGTCCMSSAIIPLSIDDGIASIGACSKACMATPWLVALGFTMVFAALLSKGRRINTLVETAMHFRRSQVTAWNAMLPLAILLLLNIIPLLVWTVVDPMRWERREICGAGDHSSYGICEIGDSRVSVGMFSTVVCVNVSALILAVVEACKSRNTLSTELSESNYIFMITMGILQISIIGVPLIALVNGEPVASYFVKSSLLFVLCMTVLLLMFLPKVLAVNPFCLTKAPHALKRMFGQPTSVSASALRSLEAPPRQQSYSRRTISGLGDGAILSTDFNDSWKVQEDNSIRERRRPKSGAEGVDIDKILVLEELQRKAGIDTLEFFKKADIITETDLTGNQDAKQPSFRTLLYNAHAPSSIDA